jgi:hypothetical protein
MKMSFLRKIFRAVPKEEMKGIHINTDELFYELDGPEDFVEMFNALIGWIPQDAILYFEDGSPDKEIDKFMTANSIPEVSHLAMGTIWPRPKVYHVPATEKILHNLAMIMEHHATPELAIHFHIYCKDKVLLEWHDAFSQPLLMSGCIPEEKVKVFASKIRKKYRKIVKQHL